MNRRDFLAWTGAATLAAPLRALAQQPQMKRLGLSMSYGPEDLTAVGYVTALRDGLRSEGWVEGKNLIIDYRYGSQGIEAGLKTAKELIALRPDVLFPIGADNVQASAMLTQTIPIVFGSVNDQIGTGLVGNLAHPVRNLTGFISVAGIIGEKWLDLLHELVPGLRRVGYLVGQMPDAALATYPPLQAAANKVGIETVVLQVRTAEQIMPTLADLATGPLVGLIVPLDGFLQNNRPQLVSEVARRRLPTIWGHDSYIGDNAIVVYSVDIAEGVRGAATYAGRVLNGEKIADLPVQLPARYVLSVNLKAAAQQGVTVPVSIIARANQVIG